jgi:hypothetical protein
MVTQYQAEIERAIDETLEYLCKEYKRHEMQAAFEIFAVHMRGAAMRIPAHVPTSKKVDPNYKMPNRFNKGQYIGPYKEKKK